MKINSGIKEKSDVLLGGYELYMITQDEEAENELLDTLNIYAKSLGS